MGAASFAEDILERLLEELDSFRSDLNAAERAVPKRNLGTLEQTNPFEQVAVRVQRLLALSNEPSLVAPQRVLSLEWENHTLKRDVERLKSEVLRLKDHLFERRVEYEAIIKTIRTELNVTAEENKRLRSEVRGKDAAIKTFKTTGRIIAPHKKRRVRRKTPRTRQRLP